MQTKSAPRLRRSAHFAAAGRRDDGCAPVFGDLQGRQADRARAAMDQDGLADLEMGQVYEE